MVDPQGAAPASVTVPYDLFLGWSDSFQGAVDEMAIWSLARSEAEVCRGAFGIPGSGGACFLPSF